MIAGITESLIISLLLFILGFYSKRIMTFYSNSLTKRKFWRLNNNNGVTVITANTPEDTRINETEFALTGYVMEYMSADKITSHIDRLYKGMTTSIDMEAYTLDKELRENLVLIGGPITNPKTKKVMERIKNLPYEFRGYALTRKNSEKLYETKFSSDDSSIDEDYGLIVNCQNPYNYEKRVIILAGCRNFGCYIGAEQLVTMKKNDLNLISSTSDYAIVVKGMVLNHSNICEISIVDYQEFNIPD